MNSNKILIIEDDEAIAGLIKTLLANDGYDVYMSSTGTDGLNLIKEHNIDLLILDIMLPGIDGLTVCKTVRKTLNIPIIILSAKSQDIDKILGLATGADDYMCKPFNPMELLARVKSQLRRYLTLNEPKVSDIDDNIISIKGLTINKNNHLVSLYDKEISLTPTEYEILLLLARNPGRVFSSEEIFEIVWKENYYNSKNTVMTHMWRLREKIEINLKEPRIIETVWGVGYKIDK